ncbi:MAG: hypothetical protein HZA95_01045 [Candidatus Vogelbacteria bacterium]|nr:hypothetical protein [Candidatus Vogelbacteria bacterium]
MKNVQRIILFTLIYLALPVYHFVQIVCMPCVSDFICPPCPDSYTTWYPFGYYFYDTFDLGVVVADSFIALILNIFIAVAILYLLELLLIKYGKRRS